MDLVAGDGAPLRLTRRRGGTKGPVLLVHGAGVDSGMFALPTQKTTFVDYLAARGYDVWNVDWRASIALPLRQFSLDDAAVHDFPVVVNAIREATGAKTVQAVVHCAGSIAFLMSLAAGYVQGVRCVVSSQVALHCKTPPVSTLKSALHVPDLLNATGIDYLSAVEDPGHPSFQKALTAMVDLLHRECTSSTCHRITFMYGHLYRHEQLSEDTHARLGEQFGRCNMTAFRHLAQLVRRGTAARFDYGIQGNIRAYGRELPATYLTPENLRIPITFVSGAENQCFLPSSTEDTYTWLRENNDPTLYERRVLPGYGHIDPFLGERADVDCYPVFAERLEGTPAS
jgi:pimeloyl-ACP methyl ester carboxylesterase